MGLLTSHCRWIGIKLLHIYNTTLKSSKHICALVYAGQIKRKARTLKPADITILEIVKIKGLYGNKCCECLSFVFCCCDKNTLMKEGGKSFVVHSSKSAEMSRWQELEAAGHFVSTVKSREECN